MKKLSTYFEKFDSQFSNLESIDQKWYQDNIGVSSFCSKAKTKDTKGNWSEEYVRARFVWSLVTSGIYNKEYICVEFGFPKGNTKTNLKPDVVVFKNKNWLSDFEEAKATKNFTKIRQNLLVIFETKKNNKSVESAVENQLRSAMNENESVERIFGVYFDHKQDVLIFKKVGNSPIKRFNETLEGDFGNLNLAKRDSLLDLPSQDDFIENNESISNPEKLKLESLDSIDEENFKGLLETLKRAKDKIKPKTDVHTLIVEFLTLKVFDEKRSIKDKGEYLQFYHNQDEDIKNFRKRVQKLYKDAKENYEEVLSKPFFSYDSVLRPSDSGDEKFLIALVREFQKRAILKTKNESFNQIIFNNFANDKQKAEKGQFFTPIPVVNAIIRFLNPIKGETFCDPACGIADFLAMGFRHMHKNEIVKNKFFETADNFYGFDTDEGSLKLAELNLVLNGDGGATLKSMDSLGQKYLENKVITKDAEFNTENYFKDTWENKNDISKNPKKFAIIATNPPFGKGRDLRTGADGKWDLPENTVKMYETYFEKSKKDNGTLGNLPKSMDMGVLFLENAYKLLEDGGRMGIILSNSIASIKEWESVRKWFLKKMRIVATFDLPSNTFGETGVATTVIIAYKPKQNEQHLLSTDYEIFVKEVEYTGYEVKTKKRIVHFEPQFIINEDTFEKTDELQEDFSVMHKDFKEFIQRQEEEIKNAFNVDSME